MSKKEYMLIKPARDATLKEKMEEELSTIEIVHADNEWNISVVDDCEVEGSAIKYLFKYINKGPDRATVYFSNSGDGEKNTDRNVDEIKEFYDCRYLSACEASWRIFGFDVHYRMPAVMRLPFHLPGKQQVIYGTEDDIDNVLEKTDSVASSMFELWMKCNSVNKEAHKLTYSEFPTKFVWNVKPRG
ncbi:uncharacterized protein LOC143588217 [Bidens hawaiensis]|uniref:uncharacterized protein LOC143588217 n=1 Tax=Bidens hawaiensis TaxID=980011 RepID=UPI004049FC5B